MVKSIVESEVFISIECCHLEMRKPLNKLLGYARMNVKIYLRMEESMTRINSLQSLRALAFLTILAAHCGCPGVQGALGVSVFFILSGFCFAINYIPKVDRLSTSLIGCVHFSVSKIGKLYVLHLLMIVYRILFLWAMPQNAGDIVKLVLQVLLLQSFVPDPYVISAYNGVSWFLSTYMFVCIAAPFIVCRVAKIERKKHLGVLFVGILVLMVVLAFASPYLTAALSLDFPTYFTYYFPPYRMLDFTLGVLLGRLYTLRSQNFQLSAYHSVLVAVVAVLCMIAGCWLYPALPAGFRENLLFVPASTLLIVLCVFSGDAVQGILSWRPAVWLGNISSNAFLIHLNVIETVRYCLNVFEYKRGLIPGRADTVVFICATFALTLAISQLYAAISPKITPQKGEQ